MFHACEEFEPDQLRVCPLAGEYFNSNCGSGLSPHLGWMLTISDVGELKKEPTLGRWPLHELIAEHKLLSAEECLAAGAFIQRCLRLNPENRATAKDLLQDEWLRGVD